MVKTRRFGSIEYDESLPGFENETRFVLLERPEWAPIVTSRSAQVLWVSKLDP